MKKKFLSNSKILFNFYLIYIGIKYKYFIKKKSYSQFSEDLILKEIFGKFVGKYVDIGCFHPIKYNNTALLHKNGWTGTNIDLNQKSIELFKACRPSDINIVACLSDKIEIIDIYMDTEFSALNSIYSENFNNFDIKNYKKKKVETKLFKDLIHNNFDYLNIDCEGNDYKILKSIDLKYFTPKVIIIEVNQQYKDKIYDYLNINGYKLYKVQTLSHIFVKR
tara:strand:+ start:337 stop:999 length:663 start_codon:yes stop_codon:yes gene_type:complete